MDKYDSKVSNDNTLRAKAREGISSLLGSIMDEEEADKWANEAAYGGEYGSLLDFVPFLGSAIGLQDASRNVPGNTRAGNYGSAALEGIGTVASMIPGATGLAKAAKGYKHAPNVTPMFGGGQKTLFSTLTPTQKTQFKSWVKNEVGEDAAAGLDGGAEADLPVDMKNSLATASGDPHLTEVHQWAVGSDDITNPAFYDAVLAELDADLVDIPLDDDLIDLDFTPVEEPSDWYEKNHPTPELSDAALNEALMKFKEETAATPATPDLSKATDNELLDLLGNPTLESLGADANSKPQSAPPQDGGKVMAKQIAQMLREGRGSEVTDAQMLKASQPLLDQMYDIPLTPEARKARAEAAGFGQYLPDLYHRSTKDFDYFKASNYPDPDLNFSPPHLDRHRTTYATKDKNFADAWKSSGDTQTLTTNLHQDEVYDPVTDRGRMRRFIADNPNLSEDDKRRYLQAEDNAFNHQSWSAVEDPEFMKMQADAGFLGHYTGEGGSGIHSRYNDEFSRPRGAQYDNGSSVNVGIFDPSRIRRKTARFDPRLSHLKHLGAGAAGAAYLGSEGSPTDGGYDAFADYERNYEQVMQELEGNG